MDYDNMMGLSFVSLPSGRDKGPEIICGLRKHHLEVRPPGDDRRGNSKSRQKWRASGRETRHLHNRRCK